MRVRMVKVKRTIVHKRMNYSSFDCVYKCDIITITYGLNGVQGVYGKYRNAYYEIHMMVYCL